MFAAQKTDLNLLGWHVPAGWNQSLPALFVIVLAPLFASFWVRRGRRMSRASTSCGRAPW